MFGISKRTVSLKEILDQIFFLKNKSLYIESNDFEKNVISMTHLRRLLGIFP